MEKDPRKQEKLDLSIYADEIIEANLGAFLLLANEETPHERRSKNERETGIPEER